MLNPLGMERPRGAESKKDDMPEHVVFFGADDGTRTRTAVGHQHLKLASLPIPAHPHIVLSLLIIGEKDSFVKKKKGTVIQTVCNRRF